MHRRSRPFVTLALATVAVLAASPAVACEDEPTTHSDSPHQIAVSPDCTTAYVTDAEGNTVSVIDLTTGESFAAIAVGAAQGSVSFTPDGGQAWISVEAEASAEASAGTSGWTRASSSAFAEIAIVDTGSNEVTSTITTAGAASSIAFSKDGSTAYTTSGDKRSTVTAIDTSSHKSTSYWGFSSPYDVVASDDGETLWVSEMHSGKVKKVDARSGKISGSYSIGHGNHALGLALSKDGSELYVASPDVDGVVVLDTETGAKVTTIKTGHSPADVQVSPDGGSIVVSATADGTVTSVDAYTYTVTATATVSVTASYTVTLLCDGDTAVVEEDEDEEPVIDTPVVTTPEASPSPSDVASTPDCPCADGDTSEPEQSDEPCDEGGDSSEPSASAEPSTPAEPSTTPTTSEPTEPATTPSASEDTAEPEASDEPTTAPSQTAPADEPAPSATPATPASPATPSESTPTASPTSSALAEAVTSPTPAADSVSPAPTGSAEAASVESGTDTTSGSTGTALASTGASPSLAIAATIAAIVLGSGLLIARRRTNAK